MNNSQYIIREAFSSEFKKTGRNLYCDSTGNYKTFFNPEEDT